MVKFSILIYFIINQIKLIKSLTVQYDQIFKLKIIE